MPRYKEFESWEEIGCKHCLESVLASSAASSSSSAASPSAAILTQGWLWLRSLVAAMKKNDADDKNDDKTDDRNDDKNIEWWTSVMKRLRRLTFKRKIFGQLGPFLNAIKKRGVAR